MLNLRRLIGTIILTFLCVFAANAQSQTMPQTKKDLPPINNHLEEGKNKQKITETNPKNSMSNETIIPQIPSLKVEAEINIKAENTYQTVNNKWWDRWFTKFIDDPIAWFTALLFIFTAFYAGISVFQVYHLKRSVDSACKAERAYIFIKVNLTNSEKPQEDKIIVGDNHVEVIATNHGKTPAILMNVTCFCVPSGTDAATDELIEKIDKVASKNPSQIPPGTVVISSGDSRRIYKTIVPLDGEGWRNISLETSKLVCLGVIHYKIIFGEIHKTVFCWEYEPFHAFHPDENPKHNYYT